MMTQAESQRSQDSDNNPERGRLAAHPAFGYAASVVSVLVGIGARFALQPLLDEHDAYTTFFPAVAMAVFFGRLNSGLLAIFLSTLAANYFFVPPHFELGTKGMQDIAGLLLFLLGAGIIVAFGEAMHRARSRASALRRNTESIEQRARQIIETANEGIWVLDETGRIIMVNPRLCEMLGYRPEEIFGRFKWDLLFPEDVEGAKALFNRRRAGFFDQVDFRFRAKSGREIWTLMVARPRFEEEGEFIGALDMFTDITERREAEQALRENETMLRLAQKAGGVGTFDWDLSSRTANCSESFFDILGLPQGNKRIATDDWIKLLHIEDRDMVLEQLSLALRDKSPCEAEYRIIRPDGQQRWIRYVGQVVSDKSGQAVRVIGTVSDITAAKIRQQELETTVAERTAQLSQVIGELEVFSYSIAHDIRAPLRAMQGLSKAVIEDFSALLPADGRDYLQRIANSANRLDRQILDVLNYSYIVRGELPMEPVELGPLLREIVTSPELQAVPAAFEVPSSLPVVHANRSALTQVISNILTNAVKFVAPGTRPHVRIRAEHQNGTVRICFEDNGIGIPHKSQQKIFGLFQRLHPLDVYEGTGIGLAIVKKAIERMGGQVGVKSEPGKGSEFWFTLKGETPAPESCSELATLAA